MEKNEEKTYDTSDHYGSKCVKDDTEAAMEKLDKIIDDFVDAIKSTKEYQEYEEEKEKMRRLPKLKAQVDDYRLQNFRIQHIEDENRLIEETEHFTKQYEKFRADKRVNDFLAKELAFCRMMQYVNHNIMESLDFE